MPSSTATLAPSLVVMPPQVASLQIELRDTCRWAQANATGTAPELQLLIRDVEPKLFNLALTASRCLPERLPEEFMRALRFVTVAPCAFVMQATVIRGLDALERCLV